jgi:predicted outer membrane repeat protein
VTGTNASYGGAICTSTDTAFTINGSAFKNNSAAANASDASGGAIYLDTDGILTITGSNFSSNGAYYQSQSSDKYRDYSKSVTGGGAIFACSVLHITTSTFINNSAAFLGGALYIYNDATSTITGSTFIENRVTGENKGPCYSMGGAIYTYSILTVTDCHFNNSAACDGGAIYSGQDIALTIVGSDFNDNFAVNDGGAIELERNVTLIISGSEFNGNTVNGNALICMGCSDVPFGGGAIFTAELTTVTITSSSFINNSVESGNGGALYINIDQVLTVTDSTSFFFNNSVAGCEFSSGGAIYSASVNADVVKFILTSTIFNSNSAVYNGGAISTDVLLDVTHSKFKSNNANVGGAIFAASAAQLTQVVMNGNSAISGGALHTQYSLNCTNSVFDNNTAKSRG